MAIRRSNISKQVTRGPATKKPVRMKSGGKPKSRVNEAGNYTKPAMRERLFKKKYKAKGGGYRD
jgi:hypothetical protein